MNFTLDEALRLVLVESAEICSGFNVAEIENTIVLEMEKVKIDNDVVRYSRFLGSIPTSLSACVLATIKQKPIEILDENNLENRSVVRFRTVM